MRTLQRFATVVFIGAAFAALISACSSSDATPPPASAGATNTAGAAGATNNAAGASNAGAPAAAGAGTAGAGTAGAAATGDAANGAVVYNAMTTACNTCHGTHGEGAHGPNITGSTPAGIGDWTLAQFSDSLRLGKNRQGGNLYLLMPKFDAAAVTDAGIADLFAYLKTQMSTTVVAGDYCTGAPCTGGK